MSTCDMFFYLTRRSKRGYWLDISNTLWHGTWACMMGLSFIWHIKLPSDWLFKKAEVFWWYETFNGFFNGFYKISVNLFKFCHNMRVVWWSYIQEHLHPSVCYLYIYIIYISHMNGQNFIERWPPCSRPFLLVGRQEIDCISWKQINDVNYRPGKQCQLFCLYKTFRPFCTTWLHDKYIG